MKYDYLEAMKSDILDYIRENYDRNCFEDRDDMEETLYDDLWAVDRITGNGSSSYYCNAYKAREAVYGNEKTLCEALYEFGDNPDSYKRALTDPEYADCTIRCYLLGAALRDALDELEEAGYFDSDES